MSTEEKKVPHISKGTLIHTLIGLSFMFLFPTLLAPIEPITPIGMWVLGIFVGMVYLWSTVSSVWPSVLGLLLFAAVGYAPMPEIISEAFGNQTMLIIMLSFVYFGAIEHYGCTQYIARFFLTRKILTGRPYVFLFIFFLCSFTLSGITSPIAPIFILWPIAAGFMQTLDIQRSDKVWGVIIFGTYLAATLAQPMFPFKGSALAIVGAFQKTTGITIPILPYVIYNITMGISLLIIFIVMVKFIFRIDVTKLRAVSAERFAKEPMPPINTQQTAYLISLVILIAALMIPSFLPEGNAIKAFFDTIGTAGVFMMIIIFFAVVHWRGEPMLAFGPVAKKYFSWDVYFLVAAALYAANAMSSEPTGVKPWLVQTLQPLLGDKPDWLFVGILLLFILLTTNFANNAGMAIVLLPIALAFADQYPSVDFIPLYVSIIFIAHFALLTPAASPYAGIMHARKDLITMKEILTYGFPVCIAGWILYTFVGQPLSNFLF